MTGARFVDRSGARLAYYVAGAGPPVLWIQGVGAAGSAWTPQVVALAGRFRCLWYDHLGLGASDAPVSPISVSSLAADALAVLDAEGVASAHVVGHSLGGSIALELALRARARVDSLGLLCTFASGRRVGASARMAWLGLRTVVGTKTMRRNAFLEFSLSRRTRESSDRGAWAARLSTLLGHDIAARPAVTGAQLRALRDCDLTRELARLEGVPAWVLSAAEDPIAPPALGRELAAALPGASFELFADAAHALPIEHAEWLTARLARHFGDAATARSEFTTP